MELSDVFFISKFNKNRRYNFLFCFLGLCLCIYTLNVEYFIENKRNYKAFCEINENINCSKVFMSKWGKSFGLLQDLLGETHWLVLPNPIYAIAFYLIQLGLGECLDVNAAIAQIIMSLLANIATVWLAYVLLFLLNNFCAVCVASYIVNFVLLLIHWNKYKILKQIQNESTDRHANFLLKQQKKFN